MKRGVSLLICLSILLTIVPVIMADEVVQNLESRIIASFDDPDAQQWYVRGSKFISDGYPLMAYAPAWPEAVFGRSPDNEDLRVLGAKAAFDKQGYNYLEFIPVVETQGGELEPFPLVMPGRVRELDLWVWGSNYDYYMEAHVRDYTGRVHVLQLGGIQYVGWQNLNTPIPTYIPQAGGYVTEGGFIKTLELLKLVLWTKPAENVSGFNVYLDQVKVLTDTFVTRFDGDNLADPNFVQDVWSSSEER